MAYKASKTEHCGAKKGMGAYFGHKNAAKKQSKKIRRRQSKEIVVINSSEKAS